MTARSQALTTFAVAALLWANCAGRLAADEGRAETPLTSAMIEGSQESTDSIARLDASESFCQTDRFWLRTDALLWWTNGVHLPPLVTMSPPGTPRSQAGVIGQPGTTIIFGNETVGDDLHGGLRALGGFWLDGRQTWAIESDYFTLLGGSAFYDSGPRAEEPIISRPFYNVMIDAQDAELVSYPGVLIGKVRVDYRDFFQSAGVWGRRNLFSCCQCDPCDPCGGGRSRRIDLIAGYRFFQLSDATVIHEDLVSGPDGALPGTHFLIEDYFRARNNFHGGEIGLSTQWKRGRFSVDLMTKVALGNNHQTVDITGATSITPPNQPSLVYSEGIYAGRTNIGTYTRDSFVAIPQVGVDLGYQWNSRLRTFAGYNFLYWARIARAADQIDQRLDPRNFPPPIDPALPYPAFPGRSSDFWAQGLNLGAELRF